MKHLRKFQTEAAYNSAKSGLVLPNVSLISETGKTDFNPLILVKNLLLDNNSLELTIGDTSLLLVTVLPSNASYPTVTWSSSDSEIATVSSTGLVTAIAAGDVVITATSTNGKTITCLITVGGGNNS